ncbi:unnamed protein product [Porites lobata]|uniref:Uncharacterized protein n=1 Tax=Porites lobata TaxID=104759 RepID=A0ABN8Q7Y0_9CNID|nr:unnamed protein product [Porites lobata]
MNSDSSFIFSWPTAAEAKKDYFLTTEDLSDLSYRIPPWHRFGMGRPSKYFDPKDLERKAEAKYGVEGFKAKVASREERNKKRKLKEESRENEAKNYEAKKSKLVEENPNTIKQVVSDMAGLVGLTKKCSEEQLQQLVVMVAEKNKSVLNTANEVKDVAMLPRKKFTELQPALAKLFNTNADAALQKSTEKQKREEQKVLLVKQLNEQAAGTWKLTVTDPPQCVGDTGDLTLDLGFGASGELLLDEACSGGDIMGFKDPKKGDQLAEKTLHFKTEQKVCGKWYKGSLSVSMSRDEEGLLLTGSFYQGFKERNCPSRWKFTGRQEGSDDSNA